MPKSLHPTTASPARRNSTNQVSKRANGGEQSPPFFVNSRLKNAKLATERIRTARLLALPLGSHSHRFASRRRLRLALPYRWSRLRRTLLNPLGAGLHIDAHIQARKPNLELHPHRRSPVMFPAQLFPPGVSLQLLEIAPTSSAHSPTSCAPVAPRHVSRRRLPFRALPSALLPLEVQIQP